MPYMAPMALEVFYDSTTFFAGFNHGRIGIVSVGVKLL